jgi:hypothetical protein
MAKPAVNKRSSDVVINSSPKPKLSLVGFYAAAFQYQAQKKLVRSMKHVPKMPVMVSSVMKQSRK